VGRKARPDATANPTKENILRRETISHSILLIMSNLLDSMRRFSAGPCGAASLWRLRAPLAQRV
jgi:hypothetical protein